MSDSRLQLIGNVLRNLNSWQSERFSKKEISDTHAVNFPFG